MIMIYVEGFDTGKLTGDISITIDGKDFDADDLVGADYQDRWATTRTQASSASRLRRPSPATATPTSSRSNPTTATATP